MVVSGTARRRRSLRDRCCRAGRLPLRCGNGQTLRQRPPSSQSFSLLGPEFRPSTSVSVPTGGPFVCPSTWQPRGQRGQRQDGGCSSGAAVQFGAPRQLLAGSTPGAGPGSGASCTKHHLPNTTTLCTEVPCRTPPSHLPSMLPFGLPGGWRRRCVDGPRPDDRHRLAPAAERSARTSGPTAGRVLKVHTANMDCHRT